MDGKDEPQKHEYKILKSDDDKHLAFGWANVAVTIDGQREPDLQGDLVTPEVLENAAYRFVEFYRRGGEMHYEGGGQVATLIESVVFTREKLAAMGIPEGTVPLGWWIGFHVLDEEVWEKVKTGEYSMFSIEGEARRVPTNA